MDIKVEINERPKKKPSNFFYTFFFGYAALKWRRLIRTIWTIIASALIYAHLPHWFEVIIDMVSGLEYRIHRDAYWIISIFFPMLLSWLAKPFVVKENAMPRAYSDDS